MSRASRAAKKSRYAEETRTQKVVRRTLFGVSLTLVILLVGAIGFGAVTYTQFSNSLHRSAMPQNVATSGAGDGTNILVMGLDSRLDEDGEPLPADVYNALHAGDESDGGYNTNVLMLVHLPANGGPAVGISIPRDDYVELPGSPDGEDMAKIKEAYGLQLDQTYNTLIGQGVAKASAYQQARAAARQEEVSTVSQFLGVPVDHFVEVTMGAFYQLAEAVQPIQVCLNEATADAYSGANFPAGLQQISASQAVSFVRQRRDTTDSDFTMTDLDRDRRQQAFLLSLAYKLKQENPLVNLGLINSLSNTASKDVAVDDGYSVLDMAQDAFRLSSGTISFTTLPIEGFAVRDGADVNLVDVDTVQADVKQLIAASDAAPSKSQAPAPAAGGSGGGAGGAATPPTQSYDNAQVPMSGGSIPCVN